MSTFEVTFVSRRTVTVEAGSELAAVEAAYELLPEPEAWVLADEYHETWGGFHDPEIHGAVIRKVGD